MPCAKLYLLDLFYNSFCEKDLHQMRFITSFIVKSLNFLDLISILHLLFTISVLFINSVVLKITTFSFIVPY